jgi:hypothetical protein
MSTEGKYAQLIAIKLALVKKYENLATVVTSKPRKKHLMHQAGRYRRQAADLSRM